MESREGVVMENENARIELDFSVGKQGERGPQGEPGEQGPQGEDGRSAYQVAVDNGFVGSEAEWLESLKSNSISGTYAEIKKMADDGQLVAGKSYIITDYQASCGDISEMIRIPDKNSSNVYHILSLRSVAVNDVPFDLILQAVSANSFEPNAIAVAKEAVDGRVRCWDAKYSLTGGFSTWDNANTESYRGSIYFLRDDLGNEAWYDFENIGYEVTKIDQPIKDILEDGFVPEIAVGAILKTFNLVPYGYGVYADNKIGPYRPDGSAVSLPFIIFTYDSRGARIENSRNIIIHISEYACFQGCAGIVLYDAYRVSMKRCFKIGIKRTEDDVFIGTVNLFIEKSTQNQFHSNSLQWCAFETVENCYFGRSDAKLKIEAKPIGLYSLKNCVFEDGHNCTSISSQYREEDSGRMTFPVHGLTVKASVKGGASINRQLMSECVSDVTKRIVAYGTDWGVYVVRESEGLVDIDGALKRVRITGNKVQQTGSNKGEWETIGVLSSEEGYISLTYKEFDTLMATGKLVPGQKYKIVDYYASEFEGPGGIIPINRFKFLGGLLSWGYANKPRELIVEAISPNELSPDAMLVSKHDKHVGKVKLKVSHAEDDFRMRRIKPYQLPALDTDSASYFAYTMYYRIKYDGTWGEFTEYDDILTFDEEGMVVELGSVVVNGYLSAAVSYFDFASGAELGSVEVGLPVGNHAEDYSWVEVDIDLAKLMKDNVQEVLWADVLYVVSNKEDFCVLPKNTYRDGWVEGKLSGIENGTYSLMKCVDDAFYAVAFPEANEESEVDVTIRLGKIAVNDSQHDLTLGRNITAKAKVSSYHPNYTLKLLNLEDEHKNQFDYNAFDLSLYSGVGIGVIPFFNDTVFSCIVAHSAVFVLNRPDLGMPVYYAECQFQGVVGFIVGAGIGLRFVGPLLPYPVSFTAMTECASGGIVELSKTEDITELQLGSAEFVFAKNNEMKTMSQLIAGE